MVDELGYPKGLIVVEKELKHFTSKEAPKRRIDILCFDRAMHPLLLIECKAQAIDEKAVTQVVGYNALIGAPLLGLAQPGAILLGWKKRGEGCYAWRSTLPLFDELLQWKQ